MHRKAIWKPLINEIARASWEIAPGPHKEGLQCPNGDACWVMAYGQKTQSFMKNAKVLGLSHACISWHPVSCSDVKIVSLVPKVLCFEENFSVKACVHYFLSNFYF